MTKIEEIYDDFISKISDYDLIMGNLTIEEIEEELSGYLKTARAKFYRCKNSLKIIKDDNTGKDSFTVELHPMEIEILTMLMVVEYLKPKMLSTELMKPFLSDKDFKTHSQGNHLKELKLLYRTMKSESNKLITEYTYLDLWEEKK